MNTYQTFTMCQMNKLQFLLQSGENEFILFHRNGNSTKRNRKRPLSQVYLFFLNRVREHCDWIIKYLPPLSISFSSSLLKD